MPRAKDVEQVEPQLIPGGLLVTVPEPVPVLVTARARGGGMMTKVTTTVWLAVTLLMT